MKKLNRILALNLLAISLASLSSCSFDSEKIDLMFGDMTVNTVTTLPFEKLKEKVDSKETFLLAVQYSDGCSCWGMDAKPVLEKFIQEKHVNIYHIKLADLDAGGNRFGVTIITGNVSFAIFENGEVKHCITTHEDTTLKKYEDFTSYFESLVALPRIYNISLDNLNSLYHKEEKNIIHFSRSTCGDCSYINEHYLKEWSKANQNYSKHIYMLDCDQPDIRLDDEGNYNQEQWFQFKDDYGLSNKNNPKYGFNGGYVPSFFLIEGNKVSTELPTFLSGAVAFNDTLKMEGNEYVVTDSYYTAERLSDLAYIDDSVETKVLKGLKVQEGDITKYGEYIAWNHEASEKYHNVFVEKFLSWCEKQ